MLCCEFALPGAFSWSINAVGKGEELLRHLKDIMLLRESNRVRGDLTVMPRDCYDDLSENELDDFELFYSRQAVRLFHKKTTDQWLLVFPEEIIEDRNTRIVLMWLMLKPFFLHCLRNGALPVHASSAEYEGKAIMIAASGDTGKTTTVRRLPLPWHEISDDAALLLPSQRGYNLHPLPTWSEFIYGNNTCAFWPISKKFKLKGIFFLQQSKVDKVEVLAPAHAAVQLQKSAMEILGELEKDIMLQLNVKIFDMVAHIIQAVPTYTLHASLDGKIWRKINEKI